MGYVSSDRYKWIDTLKGIGILLVMWGHVQQTSPLKLWISSFHVASFLVISGFLIARSGKTYEDFRNKTIKKI